MNKQEFLNTLRTRLSILREAEVNDILNEYSDVIDQKIQDGKTEEEAVKDFGSLSDLVAGILEAYKINPDRKSSNFSEDFSNIIEKTIEKASEFFLNLFRDVNSDGIAKFVVYGLVVFVVLIILRFPFLLLQALFSSFFFFGHGSFNLFGFLANGFLSFAYIACCILIIASVIKSFKTKESPFQKSKKVNSAPPPHRDNFTEDQKVEEPQFTSESTYSREFNADKAYVYGETKNRKTSSPFLQLLSTLLKIFVGFILVPFYIVLIVASGLTGWAVVLLLQGSHIFGIVLILISCIGFVGGFVGLIQRAVYHPEKGHILLSFMSKMIFSSLCLCIGLALSFSNSAAIQHVSINRHNFKEFVHTQTKDYTVDLNLNQNYCFQSDNYKIVEDENLAHELTFRVVAPTFTTINLINENLYFENQTFKQIEFVVNQIKNNVWVSYESLAHDLVDLDIRIPEHYRNNYTIKNNCLRFN